tara:strand:+ start:87 stop:242 length:156 start_codon:yes stop_codon:yes gene_type:complete
MQAALYKELRALQWVSWQVTLRKAHHLSLLATQQDRLRKAYNLSLLDSKQD